MIGIECTLDDFKNALEALNEKLPANGLMIEIINNHEWQSDYSYSSIKLYVAKIPSLLLLKVRAIHYAGLVPRITDQTDLLDILGFMGIHNIDELNNDYIAREIE